MCTDPYTDAWQLCDGDGMVRRGAMHHGTDYPCTGDAHIATPAGRYHIRCTNPVHTPSGGLMTGWASTRDDSVMIPLDRAFYVRT